MKAQTTAMIAVVAVFALIMASVGGITHSWFSDSEEADINVTTAVVQMDVNYQYLDADGVWKDFDKEDVNSQTSVSVDRQILKLENIAPGQSYYMRAVYSNNVSTIDTAHKLYATISGDINSDMTQYVKFNDEGIREGIFNISGDSYDVIPVGELPGTSDNNICYHSFKLVAGTEWSVGSTSGFQITITSDLVQVDKVISKVPVIDGKATVNVFDAGVSIPVNIEFTGLNATDAYIEVKTTGNDEVSTDDLIISFDMDSVTGQDVSFTEAKVTMIVPGDLSNGKVIYLKENDADTKVQPDVTQLKYDSVLDITTVVFVTNHFSDFALIDLSVDGDLELTKLIETINRLDALWNTPLKIKLGEGVYESEYTINEYPLWNGVADGKYGNTIGKPCLQLEFIGGNVTFTNLVTVNGAGTGVNGTGLSDGDAYVAFNGITFDASKCVSGDDRYSVKIYAGAHEVTFSDCDFINATHVIIGGAGQNHVDSITFNGCTIDACLSGYCYTLLVDGCDGDAGSKGTINNGSGGKSTVTILDSTFENEGDYVIRTATNGQGGIYVINQTSLTTTGSLLYLRGIEANIAFSGCTLVYGSMAHAEGKSDNVVTIDGFMCDLSTGRCYDTSWYIEDKTEFELDSVEQLAGLIELVDVGETFEGKTISLNNDMDLEGELFDPIGSYRNEDPFKGTFDGQGHVIYNLSQNTWGLNNGYYYGDLGLGLFGKVEDAVIKNVIMDGADISGESAICGTIAATSYGDTVFENITVRNSKVADYQYYAGGIVGWAAGTPTFKNITIDSSTSIAAQWGDFDNAVGGIIGGASGSAEITLENCTVECRIDAYNDVTSSYQWYAYRRAGMLIGNTGMTVTENGTTYASAPQLTCNNVTVVYGEWSYYHYCEFAGTSWPYVRCEAGISNSEYSNPRYGHPTDANGNMVVNDNHVHNDGEDHKILCEFDQLYGGGQGVYGGKTHDGVTIIHKIDSLGGLMDFRDVVNGGSNYSGRTVVLSSDIDLNDENWIPIGTSTNPFKGTFDGKGYTISNLKIGDEGSYFTGDHAGLFGSITKATIKDVIIDNVDIRASSNVGALVGSSGAGGIINGCSITGDIVIKGNYKVGGLVGDGYSKIVGCSVVGNDGSIIAGEYKGDNLEGDNVGGIIGFLGEDSTVSDCSAKIDISGVRKVGGIIGSTPGGSNIDRCHYEGAASIIWVDEYSEGKNLFLGGILGEVASGKLGTFSDNSNNAVFGDSVADKDVFINNGDIGGSRSGSITTQSVSA